MTPVVHSLMKRDGTLLDGWDGKSDLLSCVRKEANVPITDEAPCKFECVAVDAMFVINQIPTKPVWVKNGADLAKEFCKRVDQQSEGADIVVIGFEWYSDSSLKSITWNSRNKKGKSKKRNDYIIEPDTDLTKRCMQDILGTTATKKSLTTLLMDASKVHLQNRNVGYFIAGNGVTFSSYPCNQENNHSEGETAIILGLSTISLRGKNVLVYGSDVDLFALLLAHYQIIDCAAVFMKSLSGYTCVNAIHNFLGVNVASALLAFHGLSGCDIAGKFSGKTKEFWTKRFLAERDNSEFIQALLSLLSSHQSEAVVNEIGKFFCRAYCPKRTPKRVTANLVETRYHLYKKYSSETSKLPPSPGAFLQHVKRACVPLISWTDACKSNIRDIDHFEYGWEKCDGVLMPKCTEDEVAPEDLITLVSCSCNGECSNNHCTCKKNNVACTDFCGCGDACQNTDMRPNLCEDENGEAEEEEEEEEETEFEEEENEEDESGEEIEK